MSVCQLASDPILTHITPRWARKIAYNCPCDDCSNELSGGRAVFDSLFSMRKAAACVEITKESPWSQSYEEARNKFRAAAAACGAKLETIAYDSRAGFEGVWRAHAPDGALPNLSIDIATLGDPATADGIIIHTSGVHGVEGYTGSAIQIAFLRRAADTKPNPKVALVLVHAVNALGMAEFRRWNERGVDLNRNYIGVREGAVIEGTDTPATFANLAALPYDLYKKVSSAINIEAPSILPRVEFYSSIVPALLRYGFGSLKQAIAGGNYLPSAAEKVKASRQPEVFYGGFEMEQSVRLLHDLLERLGRKRTRAMPRAFHIDVHTGLGSYGHDSLLATDTRGEAGHVTSLEALSAALGGDGTAEGAERVRGEGYHVEIEGDSASGGTAYTSYGLVKDGVLIAFANAVPGGIGQGGCVVQEFGTRSNLAVFQALRAEAALLRDAESRGEPAPPASHPVRQALREAFYPDDAVWRETVLARGLKVLEQAVGWAGES